MKRTVVDNTKITAFFGECQEVVSRWNAARPTGGGEIKTTLELANRHTDEKVICLDPEPEGIGRGARMTMLKIWFDHDTSTFKGKTPGLPVDTTQVVSLDMLRHVLDRFNP